MSYTTCPLIFICCISALDYGVNIAEYYAFLFKVAVGFVDLIAQLLVLTFRKNRLCCSQHCGNTSEAELEISSCKEMLLISIIAKLPSRNIFSADL